MGTEKNQKKSIRAENTQNVLVQENKSSATGNLVKSIICDLTKLCTGVFRIRTQGCLPAEAKTCTAGRPSPTSALPTPWPTFNMLDADPDFTK